MILELDLGNSRTKWRVRDAQNVLARGHLPARTSLSQLESSLSLFKPKINRILVASVVGDELEEQLLSWCLSYLQLKPEFARSCAECAGVVNGYTDPSKLGVDRWVGAVWVHNYLRKPVILASFGTAITVDLIMQNGNHVGGYIGPGIGLMLGALTQGTQKVTLDCSLPEFNLHPGLTTADAVHAALAAMVVGLIEKATENLREIEGCTQVEMVFTGGDAEKILPFYPTALLVSELVLDGLRYIFNDSERLEQ